MPRWPSAGPGLWEQYLPQSVRMQAHGITALAHGMTAHGVTVGAWRDCVRTVCFAAANTPPDQHSQRALQGKQA
jgi:hypothetical protein